jgi:hypothetical protein
MKKNRLLRAPSRGKALGLLGLLSFAAAAGLVGCQLAPLTEQRDLSFDVPAPLFGSPTDANPGNRGPGIDSISVVVTVKGPDGKESDVSGSFPASGMGVEPYASFAINVTGTLTKITVDGSLAGAPIVSVSASDFSSQELQRYGGWTTFGNVTHFKLDWSGGDITTGMLRILPCPRPSAVLLVDSGAPSGPGNTDRAAGLSSLQVAVQLVAAEDTANEDLSYDMYYAVSTNDPSVDYNTASFPNTYIAHPWAAQWTYQEVTGTGGKLIGETTYVMTKLAGDPRTAGTPDADGKLAALIDLSSVDGAVAGEYLLSCAVLTRGSLAVPTDVACVLIR